MPRHKFYRPENATQQAANSRPGSYWLWTRLGGSTLEEIATELTAEFGTTFDEALNDTNTLIGQLQARGFVVRYG